MDTVTTGILIREKQLMQCYLAAAVNTPVTVMETASEGGAWGIALLAAYMDDGKRDGSLETFLDRRIFSTRTGEAVVPEEVDVEGFEALTRCYSAGLEVEKVVIAAVDW